MKKIMAITLMGLVGYLGVLPENEAQAANEDECAIWICLPAGFGEGCGGARSAFKKRLSKGKSPLPSWNSCSEGNEPEPYSYKRKYKTYTNYGKGKVKENSGRNCPHDGVIYWYNQQPSRGVEAICTATEIYTTTFYDGSGVYVHEEERWGKPLSVTMNKEFKADHYRGDREIGNSR
ncbi:hypothetical protein [Xenorhabdus bovienii]|uniref:hypothetical protein n=1 Tax=Xenorhabdus bovienii TaxID=40576 RepID=UPI0023B25E0A|nr:hypothetical protein [Xenorhabdus bovienii]MDE9544142.1 hypothetical protein [Xenorhabdus bovienii]